MTRKIIKDLNFINPFYKWSNLTTQKDGKTEDVGLKLQNIPTVFLSAEKELVIAFPI